MTNVYHVSDKQAECLVKTNWSNMKQKVEFKCIQMTFHCQLNSPT